MPTTRAPSHHDSAISTVPTPRDVVEVLTPLSEHWVGDGFPVRTLFAYDRRVERLSPFLLLDHAGPADFPPTGERRGVGAHPHRGFETVTIAFSGAVAHRDSAGGGGVIQPGDVQWMTAGDGVVHEEFHDAAWARGGGRFHMAQIWVNLPRANKRIAPRYQHLAAADIPDAPLTHEDNRARVIAGTLHGATGPAQTFSPMQMVELRLAASRPERLEVPAGWNAMLVVLDGAIRCGASAREGRADQVLLLESDGGPVAIDAIEDAHLLLLAGAPLDEPVVGRGPFVMSTPQEIVEAYADFRDGRLGQLVRER